MPADSGAGDVFAPELVTQPSDSTAVIMVPTFDNPATFRKTVDRINKSLFENNQNVEFLVEKDDRRNAGLGYRDRIKTEFTSGSATADAYTVFSWEVSTVFSGLQTLDVTELLQEAAPGYCARCRDAIDRIRQDGWSISGIPVGYLSPSINMKTGFMLRKDFDDIYKTEFRSLDDIFQFVDYKIVNHQKSYSIIAEPGELIDLWAKGQNYYCLEYMGIYGYQYAKIVDPDCIPVLLERIPGFDDFIATVAKLYSTGVFMTMDSPAIGRECIGILRNVGDYYLPFYNNSNFWVTGQLAAHELYPELPSYPHNQPDFNGMLLIPKGSTRARDICEFIEWLYSSQSCYDTVIYGQDKADYTMVNDRLSLLQDGEPVKGHSSDTINKVFFGWPGVKYFGNSDYLRLPENVPINLDQIFSDGGNTAKQFHLDKLLCSTDEAGHQILQPDDEMQAIISERDELINEMLVSIAKHNSCNLYVTRLKNLKNDSLSNVMQSRMKQFIEYVSKQ